MPHTMKEPNILLITSDQLRVYELECYSPSNAIEGKPTSPNIDALASEGVRFEHAFTSSPFCTPARASLYSGQYARRCMGRVINAPEPVAEREIFPCRILPELLRDEGYRTALIGKWHLHTRPDQVGFDHCIYPEAYHSNYDQKYHVGDRHRKIPGAAYEFELSEAGKYIRGSGNEPFFLNYNMVLPHMPFYDVDDRFKHMYSPDEITLRKNVGVEDDYNLADPWYRKYFLRDDCILHEGDDFVRKWFKIYYYGGYPNPFEGFKTLPEDFDMKRLHALYRGMVAAADMQVGRLMGYLEDAGKLENTIVLFTSDHGDDLGSHGMFNKDVALDEASRIPMIVRTPDGATEVRRDRAVSIVDIAPTILNLCGLGVPPYMQGVDLLSDSRRKDVFIECPNGEIALRTDRYLFSIMTDTTDFSVKDDNYRFHDSRHDPYQMENLHFSRDPVIARVREELQARTLHFHRNSYRHVPGKPLEEMV